MMRDRSGLSVEGSNMRLQMRLSCMMHLSWLPLSFLAFQRYQRVKRIFKKSISVVELVIIFDKVVWIPSSSGTMI
jgi:hypothetical protein